MSFLKGFFGKKSSPPSAGDGPLRPVTTRPDASRGSAPMKASRQTAKRMVVVVNQEWAGELDENFLGYTLQTNGVSVDRTHVHYVNNQSGSMEAPLLEVHRAAADAAAAERGPQFLKCFRAVHPTGKYCGIYVYGDNLR